MAILGHEVHFLTNKDWSPGAVHWAKGVQTCVLPGQSEPSMMPKMAVAKPVGQGEFLDAQAIQKLLGYYGSSPRFV